MSDTATTITLRDENLIDSDEGCPYQYCEAYFHGVESTRCPNILHKGDQAVKQHDALYCLYCASSLVLD